MNVLNNSSDDVVECPLCMEPLEVDDLNFFPCTCGYQICRFCWHRIRTDENELCPACRKAYPENPADFTPLSQEQIAALKAEKRQRDQQRKQKITENRKHLANVRVVQKNLVFVVGLPPRLADADILKKYEYFGKYGKIHKVVINPSTTYAGVQGPSASAYVTYVHNNDALRAIQSVNNIMIDGRLIKTSLGTTKYCSHFMKNQQCPKSDCMYLHELGDSEASFTKEEMHQGKHQEYEKRLHDALIASSSALGTNTTQSPTVPIPNIGGTNVIGNNNHNNPNNNINGNSNGPAHNKEAWPSLSISPVSNIEKEKEQLKMNSKSSKNCGSGGNNKENNKKHDKTKSEKKSQKHQKSNSSNNNNHNNSCNNNHNKDLKESIGLKENNTTNIQIVSEQQSIVNNVKDHNKTDKIVVKEPHKNRVNSLDEEIDFIDQLEKGDFINSDDNNVKGINGNSSGGRSLSSSSSTSSASSSVFTTSVLSSSCNSDSVGSLSETASGKSSPGNFPEHVSTSNMQQQSQQQQKQQQIANSNIHLENSSSQKVVENKLNQPNGVTTAADKNNKQPLQTNDTNSLIDTSACLSKLSLFDDNNSFFSSSSFQPLIKGKLDNESRTLMNNHLNSAISSHLPDLLNGIDNYQNNTNNSLNGNNGAHLGGLEDWEAAFKFVLMRNNKQIEDQQQQQHHQQQHQHQQHHQEEFMRIQEIQKRNNLLSNIGMNQTSGFHDFTNTDFGGSDLNRLTQQVIFHQQQQHQQQQRQATNLQHNDILNNSLFGSTNMSKFFDFHKTQQQQQHHHQQHQYNMMNGMANGFMNDQREHLNITNILDSNRLNSQLLEHANGMAGQQLQKQRYNNKYDPISGHSNHQMLLNNQNSNSQQSQSRIPNQFSQNSSVDDDLGFDPFIETQKALAELMENENQAVLSTNSSGHNNKQQNMLDNCQRTRMPPPGFNHMNHMNAFGFGVPRAQGSKILPFMNMSGNSSNGGNNTTGLGSNNSNSSGITSNMQQQPNNWPQHLGFNQNPQLNDQQMQQHLQNGTNTLNKSGYGNIPDWTAMDPAILSFRQFPFSSHQQQQPQHNADMFMQHLNQQNLQQSAQGFGHHGVNNLLNQQNSQTQMSFPSHSTNWLNNDQSLFMNSLTNGYNNANNYDKFSIPMPPGIHSNNMSCIPGNKQQKTECIN